MSEDAATPSHPSPGNADDREPNAAGIADPPRTLGGIFRSLGPGLIIAGSIVGSGELIATTVTGGEAGFSLLWLIVIGCVIKVFTQVELGRFTIVAGQTAMEGLNQVPGPRIGRRGNWLVWYWLAMFLASLGQLGGIVGSVGQALAISAPITEAGRSYNEYVDAKTSAHVSERALEQATRRAEPEEAAQIASELERARVKLASFEEPPEVGNDDKIWATIVTVLTAILLVVGRYGLIQSFATALVALFTLVTIANLFFLQSSGTWAITGSELWSGLRFSFPPADPESSKTPLFTALAAFGIIGVGASELVAYPYWCLEKGYARFTGRRDGTPAWTERARGWLRVLRWDAWCSMAVYTFATVAFYLLGAAILGRTGLKVEGSELIRALAVMYEPVFGRAAEVLFLFGSIAVLYSTFFVANAGHAYVCSDALRVFGFGVHSSEEKRAWTRRFSALFPFICLTAYLFLPKPKALVLASGVMQAMMLPMLAGAALYFRYRRSDAKLAPGRLWDSLLWISALGMLIAGIATAVMAYTKFSAS